MYQVLGGTYNSFRQQPGYCFLQGYDTVSRNSSGIFSPMFLDGRVWSGVGLSNFQFNDSVSSCGACIQIESIQMNPFNHELTQWEEDRMDLENQHRIVMVMDQCKDPICESGWLDFDVYSPDFPPNPIDIKWQFVPCPVADDESIGLLFCPSNACQRNFTEERTIEEVVRESDPYFWALYIQNSKYPIRSITIRWEDGETNLQDANGWMFNSPAPFDFFQPFQALLCTDNNTCLNVDINLQHQWEEPTTLGYRGGWIVDSQQQFKA